MKRPRVENRQSSKGNDVPKQFCIFTDEGTYFQSYSTIIAFKPFGADKKIQLDRDKWNYSMTTGKYRNQFLCETRKETERKIATGEYELVDLNK